MKVLFVEARKKLTEFDIRELRHLPKQLHILYSIQYKNLARRIKKELEKEGFEVLAFQQVLGCSKINPKASLLLVGSGRFHALQLALSTGKEVFIYPSLEKITQHEITREKIKDKAKIAVFFNSEKIGLLFSTKPGQNKIDEAAKSKKELGKKYNKKFYSFVSETLSKDELENFPLPIFINFACPGLGVDSQKIINYKKIKNL